MRISHQIWSRHWRFPDYSRCAGLVFYICWYKPLEMIYYRTTMGGAFFVLSLSDFPRPPSLLYLKLMPDLEPSWELKSFVPRTIGKWPFFALGGQEDDIIDSLEKSHSQQSDAVILSNLLILTDPRYCPTCVFPSSSLPNYFQTNFQKLGCFTAKTLTTLIFHHSFVWSNMALNPGIRLSRSGILWVAGLDCQTHLTSKRRRKARNDWTNLCLVSLIQKLCSVASRSHVNAFKRLGDGFFYPICDTIRWGIRVFLCVVFFLWHICSHQACLDVWCLLVFVSLSPESSLNKQHGIVITIMNLFLRGWLRPSECVYLHRTSSLSASATPWELKKQSSWCHDEVKDTTCVWMRTWVYWRCQGFGWGPNFCRRVSMTGSWKKSRARRRQQSVSVFGTSRPIKSPPKTEHGKRDDGNSRKLFVRSGRWRPDLLDVVKERRSSKAGDTNKFVAILSWE